MQALLFHELGQATHGAGVVIKLVASFIKFQLPSGEHESVESLLHGGCIWKQFLFIGAWEQTLWLLIRLRQSASFLVLLTHSHCKKKEFEGK